MIGVLGNPLTGRAPYTYQRAIRYTKQPEDFQYFTSLGEIPSEIKVVVVFEDYSGDWIKQILGRYILIQKARGYQYLVGDRIFIFTFDPGILNARMYLLPVVIWDFKTALKADPSRPPQFPLAELELSPTPDSFKAFCECAKTREFLAVDLETPTEKDEEVESDYATTIVRASLAYPVGEEGANAITFPWVEPYISTFTDLMDTEVPKVFWNGWGFDLGVLEENQIPIRGRIYDAMWLYHFLQPTLPKALGAVTTLSVVVPEWKSLNSEQPELYSAMDAWATVKDFVWVRRALKARGVWDLSERHVTDILYVLDTMRRRGVGADQDSIEKFNIDLDAKMGPLQEKFNEHPDLKPLRGLHPKQKDGTFGYKKVPKDITGLVEIEVHREPTEEEVALEITKVIEKRWAKLKPFLATSPDQVAKYLTSKGYTFTDTDESSLQQLYRKHKDPLILDFLEYRGLVKLKGTYGGVEIGPDGRIHSTFTLRPDTGRFSSIEPNLQNWPEDARYLLVPREGNQMLEIDWSSIEAFLTGFFAGDPEYMRRSQIGIHKLAMAEYLGIKPDFSQTNEELKELVKDIKDRDHRLYRGIKAVVYGGNYLAGARTTYQNNPTAFSSEAEAKIFLRFCKKLSPKIPTWQNRTCEQARVQKGLNNAFGYFKAFWDLDKDGPAACAFLPQSTVAAMMREVMWQIFFGTNPKTGLPYVAREYLVLQIHDSLCFDVPKDKVEQVRDEVLELMIKPWAELGGLSVGAEAKVGNSLMF